MTKHALLSIDWDYFFPEPIKDPQCLYDWGHNENKAIFLGAVWSFRAAAFIRNGIELPMSTGLEKNFWSRFQFSKYAKMYVTESHSMILSKEVTEGITEVHSYDAHHDAGYNLDEIQDGKISFDCGNWVAHFFTKSIPVNVYYPKWKTWAFESEFESVFPVHREFDSEMINPVVFDKVFICRSGAWTPPWIDRDFNEFVANCPVQRKYNMGLFPREWGTHEKDDVQRIITKENELMSKEVKQ